MSAISGNLLAVAIGACAILSASGCATGARQASTFGAPASGYTSADRLFASGRIDDLRPDSPITGERLEPSMLAAYEGLDGARLAHRIFGQARAEKLDGACEQYVKIVQGETLYDIAQYCDVPVELIVSANPVIRNPRHVEAGDIIEVPQLFNAERHALGGAGSVSGVQYASFYVVQKGDTLTNIAARHLISPAALANLNPGADWARLPVGYTLKLPAVAAIAAPSSPSEAAPVVPPAVASAYGAAAVSSSDGDDYVPPAEVTAMMPYASSPAHAAPEQPVAKSLALAVDRTIVKPGGSVTLSAVGLPANKTVSIYRGAHGGALQYVMTVKTDAKGGFSESVAVTGSDPGGVIFRAMIDETGEQLQSPRVGIDKIKP